VYTPIVNELEYCAYFIISIHAHTCITANFTIFHCGEYIFCNYNFTDRVLKPQHNLSRGIADPAMPNDRVTADSYRNIVFSSTGDLIKYRVQFRHCDYRDSHVSDISKINCHVSNLQLIKINKLKNTNSKNIWFYSRNTNVRGFFYFFSTHVSVTL